MQNVVQIRLQSLQLGEAHVYRNIAILPLIAPADGTFQYRTLGESITSGDLLITEVSTAGSVPELLVVNRAKQPVLLVDGEELAGAKQNRVLNTSILLKEASETKIPVSCTEHGRWSYASKEFSESGNVMAYKGRSRKTSSVQFSLEASGAYNSNQAAVWDDIAELQFKACAPSPTSAMSDVYRARERDLRKCDEIFKPLPSQVGLVAFIAGALAGLDILSLRSAYARLHPKLVRSYTLEGLLASSPAAEQGSGESEGFAHASPDGQYSALAKAFLDELTATEERRFSSIGYGTDFRYRSPLRSSGLGLPPGVVGSALLHENEVIHAAFFRLDETHPLERMGPFRQRRRHFSE